MKAIQMKRLIESVKLILDTMEETNYPEITSILDRMYADADTATRRLDLVLERKRLERNKGDKKGLSPQIPLCCKEESNES